jgi:hypothetical protein
LTTTFTRLKEMERDDAGKGGELLLVVVPSGAFAHASSVTPSRETIDGW